MHRLIYLLVFVSAILVIGNEIAFCWDISYEGDAMPNSSTLGTNIWSGGGDLSLSSVNDGILHTVDSWTNKTVYFYRESGFPARMPITVETKIRVLSVSSPGWWWGRPGFGIQTWSQASTGGMARLEFTPNGVITRYSGDTVDREYVVDLTQWHTFRIAMNSSNYFNIWMDNSNLIFSGSAYTQGQDGIFFGIGSYNGATGDIEWDYVRYSHEYLPLPEPSSLLALSFGFVPMGLALARRKYSKQ
jgi:hypothetical protein